MSVLFVEGCGVGRGDGVLEVEGELFALMCCLYGCKGYCSVVVLGNENVAVITTS
jgi:hypothetical protein